MSSCAIQSPSLSLRGEIVIVHLYKVRLTYPQANWQENYDFSVPGKLNQNTIPGMIVECLLIVRNSCCPTPVVQDAYLASMIHRLHLSLEHSPSTLESV